MREPGRMRTVESARASEKLTFKSYELWRTCRRAAECQVSEAPSGIASIWNHLNSALVSVQSKSNEMQ